MRIMAIDYGDERTGIAVSDPTGFIAGDAFVIRERSQERLADKIASECEKRGVTRLVVGNPLRTDGKPSERSEKSIAFARLLRDRTGIETVMWDERNTTVDAHRILTENGVFRKKRKSTVDAVAASLILGSYLDAQR